MDLMECIKTRQSIRKFRSKPVSKLTLANVLEAGCFAPSAGNYQPWRFIVVTDLNKKKTIAGATLQPQIVNKAPVTVVVCSIPDRLEKEFRERGKVYSLQSCAAAIQNVLLAAHSAGLGALWIGALAEPKIRKALEIPDTAEVHAVLAIGYYDKAPKQIGRMPLHRVTFFNEWNEMNTQKKFFPVSQIPAKLKTKAKGIKEAIVHGIKKTRK